ncbi:MAG: hypothetical protein HOW73_05805 [Polyangiaceae bacterium]|nr:hypothetical protein [Polyangiaceae bacterium]
MKLARATFLSIKGLPDLTCDFVHPDTGLPLDVAVVTGPAQSGKTRVLEALAVAKDVIAPYDAPPEDGEAFVRDDADSAKIELTFAIDAEEQRRFGLEATAFAEALFTSDEVSREADDALVALLSQYEHAARAGKIEYFPASRGLASYVDPHLFPDDQGSLRTSKSPSKYAFVPAYLATLAKNESEAQRFATLLGRLCPRLSYARPERGDPVRCIVAPGRSACHPKDLSSTEVDAVVIAATASLIHFERSIVLIDRPERSADETSFATWLAGARSLAEDVQLILASSSPAVIASVDPGAVVLVGAAE